MVTGSLGSGETLCSSYRLPLATFSEAASSGWDRPRMATIKNNAILRMDCMVFLSLFSSSGGAGGIPACRGRGWGCWTFGTGDRSNFREGDRKVDH